MSKNKGINKEKKVLSRNCKQVGFDQWEMIVGENCQNTFSIILIYNLNKKQTCYHLRAVGSSSWAECSCCSGHPPASANCEWWLPIGWFCCSGCQSNFSAMWTDCRPDWRNSALCRSMVPEGMHLWSKKICLVFCIIYFKIIFFYHSINEIYWNE